nr:hypothetical protein CFP56_42061 [Quercus suber]
MHPDRRLHKAFSHAAWFDVSGDAVRGLAFVHGDMSASTVSSMPVMLLKGVSSIVPKTGRSGTEPRSSGTSVPDLHQACEPHVCTCDSQLRPGVVTHYLSGPEFEAALYNQPTFTACWKAIDISFASSPSDFGEKGRTKDWTELSPTNKPLDLQADGLSWCTNSKPHVKVLGFTILCLGNRSTISEHLGRLYGQHACVFESCAQFKQPQLECFLAV